MVWILVDQSQKGSEEDRVYKVLINTFTGTLFKLTDSNKIWFKGPNGLVLITENAEKDHMEKMLNYLNKSTRETFTPKEITTYLAE